MNYEQYIRSGKPVCLSVTLSCIALLLPLSILALEGWHSGVAYGVGIALAVGVFIPGIYLLRPLAFYIWAALSAVASISGTLVVEHYWRAAPDWMDAQMPRGIAVTIRACLLVIQASILILGTWGWVHYFRLRKTNAQNA